MFNNGMTTAANAKVSQANSVFTFTGKSDIVITGSGVLDGNLANQYNIAGATYNRTSEDLFSSCGISFSDCDNIRINGSLTIRNFVLHGIATAENVDELSTNIDIEGVTFDGQVDKAIAVINIDRFRISNCNNYNGVDEGEIICYNGCYNGVIENIVSYNNRRYGVALTGQNNGNITLNNLVMTGNQTYDVYIQNQLYGTNISNVICSGSAAQAGTFVINSCKNVDIKNLQIFGKTGSPSHLSIAATTAYAATSDDIRIDGLTIKDSNPGSPSRSISIGNTNRAIIQNFSIDGVYRPFNEGTGNGLVKFINGYVGTYASTLFETDNSNFIFKNVKGIITENLSSATVANGATSVIINHLLDRTPLIQNIKVTPTNNMGNASHFWISDVNGRTFKINVDTDPGATTATFRWEITTLFNDITTEPTYTTNYTSDFSAGVDGWSSNNLVSSGNNDAVSDGATSLDNVLKTYADATNGAHDLSKAIAHVGTLNRITFKYYIPSAQTNVNGLRVYGNVFGTTIISLSLGAESAVVGTWTEVTTAYYTPTSTTVYIRLMKTYTTSYAGANSAADDILYLKDIVVERI
jgi:hypothetical protein